MIQNTMLTPLSATGLSSAGPVVGRATPAEVTDSFASFLKNALDGVAAQEHSVHTVTDKFIIGEADINEVMLASTKADLSLALTSAVRNKAIEAYHEIMRMQM